MTSTISTVSTINTTHTTRNSIEAKPVNCVVHVEHVHIEKDIVTTNVIHIEQVNQLYNIQNRIIHEPLHNIGSIIDITA